MDNNNNYIKINTHGIKIDFGKHSNKGDNSLVTRLPLSYIKWMINSIENRMFIDKKAIDKLIQLDFPNRPIESIPDNIKKDWIKTHQELVKPHIYKWSDIAKAELERRGDTLPKVEISGHAIDKASLRVIHKWKTYNEIQVINKNSKIGFYTWLMIMTLKAQTKEIKNGKYHYMGMKFVIEQGNKYPILKSIML